MISLSEKQIKKTKSEPDSKPVNIDSIHIEKISGFEIDRFDFNDVQYTIVDSLTHEVLFQHKPASFNLDGFQLKKIKDQIFKVELIDKVFKIDNIMLDVGNENYNLSIKEVNLDTKTSDVQIIDLKLNPVEGKMALANKFKYNDVVLNFDIERIQLSHIDFTKLFKNQGVFVDSIIVTKGVFDFYKDKRKPFNEKLVKKLPQELLKDLKTPLFIDHISLDSCQILAENRFPNKDSHMKLYIDHINGKIKNISNIKSQAHLPMEMDMQAKLMNEGVLKVELKFRLNDPKNHIYFKGSLGPSKFKYYDKVIYPALGLKVLKGSLDHLSFSGRANNYASSGTMRMLYHDLNATVYKKSSYEKSRFFSWAVSTVLHNSNPVIHKKVRVAKMYHKHDKYRGFGGYLWKTLQSGIVNTLSPMGNKTSRKSR